MKHRKSIGVTLLILTLSISPLFAQNTSERKVEVGKLTAFYTGFDSLYKVMEGNDLVLIRRFNAQRQVLSSVCLRSFQLYNQQFSKGKKAFRYNVKGALTKKVIISNSDRWNEVHTEFQYFDETTTPKRVLLKERFSPHEQLRYKGIKEYNILGKLRLEQYFFGDVIKEDCPTQNITKRVYLYPNKIERIGIGFFPNGDTGFVQHVKYMQNGSLEHVVELVNYAYTSVRLFSGNQKECAESAITINLTEYPNKSFDNCFSTRYVYRDDCLLEEKTNCKYVSATSVRVIKCEEIAAPSNNLNNKLD